MKKNILKAIGGGIIAIGCAIPAGYFIARLNEGYSHCRDLYLLDPNQQLLAMANWYVSRCWIVIGVALSAMIFLMSIWSICIKTSTTRHNLLSIALAVVYAAMIFGINQLLFDISSLHPLINYINPVLNLAIISFFAITNYTDSKKHQQNN